MVPGRLVAELAFLVVLQFFLKAALLLAAFIFLSWRHAYEVAFKLHQTSSLPPSPCQADSLTYLLEPTEANSYLYFCKYL